MTLRPRIKDALWMAAGAGVMLLMVLPALYFGTDEESARRHDSRARSIELVDRMRLSLASASEAEKSAVLSKADEDSEAHAGQARAAVADVERVRKDLLNLLAKSGTQKQRDALEQFAGAFVEFRKVDDEILALAVRNTNLKAYSLAFGPAAVALEEMDAALSRLATTSAPSPRGQQVNLLVFGARTAALRIQVLLAPHIAEETDERMDDLEARMAGQDEEVRKGLDGLATLTSAKGQPELEAATAAYGRFAELRSKILALSRENSNVRSAAISLNRKRKVMLVCQDALAALRQAIVDEPQPGADYGRFGRPVSPR